MTDLDKEQSVIRAEASISIDRSPREVLEFVLDLDRYRQADTKITKVDHQPHLAENTTEGRARYRGRLRGLPTPPQWQLVQLDPWRSLRLCTAPDQWTARLAQFEGGFVCDETGSGATTLTHYEQFDFRRPIHRLADPYLRKWMQRYLEDEELPRLKALIESQSTT